MDKKNEALSGIRLDLAERSFYRFSMLSGQINRCVTGAYVQKFGRPAHGWKVLTALGRFGQVSMTEITRHTTLEIDKITRIVDALVEQGLVVRKQENSDRRRVMVSLTAKGKRVVAWIEYIIYAMEREFLIALDITDRESLYRVLDLLQVRANQVFSGPRPWKRFL